MRRTKILSACALACCFGALSVNAMFARGAWRRQIPLPIHEFPRQVGGWESVEDRPLEADVQWRIPSADVLDRMYANPSGHVVNMLLVTAADTVDIHDPQQCLPGQGWEIQQSAPITISGQAMTDLHVRKGAETLEALFWWTEATSSTDTTRRTLQNLLHRLGGRGTLLIRLSAPDTPANHAVLLDFARQTLAPLQTLKSHYRERSH